MDITHTITKFIDHNRGTVIGLTIAIACGFTISCGNYDGKVTSSASGKLSTSDELKSEYTIRANQIAIRFTEIETELAALNKEDALRAAAVDADLAAVREEILARNDLLGKAGQMAATATGASWILPLLGLGGIAASGGVGYDNWRKDRIIKQNKSVATT